MRKNLAKLLIVMSPAIFSGACVGGSNETKKEAREALKGYVLDQPPPDVGRKVNINYDNKITLLGAKVEPAGAVKPGQRVKVTMYWKVDQELKDKGWKLFTHIVDGAGERILNIDNVGPLRRIQGDTQVMGPSEWAKGKVYVDEQEFTLPKKVKTSTVQVTVGIWRGNDRLPTVAGPHDRSNRGLAATIRTTPDKSADAVKSTRVPELRVDKLEKAAKIKVDGVLDEDAWKNAPSSGKFVDVRTGRPNATFPVNGTAKLLWDDKGLYIGFDIVDPDVVGGFEKDKKDPHLWTKDVVEIMVDPEGDGDNRDYYEIQVNPQNLVFDSQFDLYNKPKGGPEGPFGHEEWSAGLKSAVTVKGTLDKPGDKDEGYVVEVMIPWKSFNKAKKTPPAVGDTWRLNFYAMQNNSGVAWSPILGQGNFHRASRFGKVLWAEKGWTPPPESESAEGDKPEGDQPGKGEAAKPAAPGSAGAPTAPASGKVMAQDPTKQKPKVLKPRP